MHLRDEGYTNEATSKTPAHAVFLIDVSESMGKPPEQRPIDTVETTLHKVLVQIVRMCTDLADPQDTSPVAQPITKGRFQVAIIGYNEEIYNPYGGFIPIDELIQRGVPKFKPAGRTNPLRGFQEVDRLLAKLLLNLDPRSPAPLVCHLTDAKRNEQGSPVSLVERIMRERVTPDGPVLIENVYMREGALRHPIKDLKKWPGVRKESDLTNPFAQELFEMSSTVPKTYLRRIRRLGFPGLDTGARLLFPGTMPQIIMAALATTGVTVA